jgi:hypothetical protein
MNKQCGRVGHGAFLQIIYEQRRRRVSPGRRFRDAEQLRAFKREGALLAYGTKAARADTSEGGRGWHFFVDLVGITRYDTAGIG